jgi:hypothetical protein
MANFKRRKSKRIVRCTLCTAYRWMGNSKQRLKAKELSAKNAAVDATRDADGSEAH